MNIIGGLLDIFIIDPIKDMVEVLGEDYDTKEEKEIQTIQDYQEQDGPEDDSDDDSGDE